MNYGAIALTAYVGGLLLWCVIGGILATNTRDPHSVRTIARVFLVSPVWPVALVLVLLWYARPASLLPSASAECPHERHLAEMEEELARVHQLRADEAMDRSRLMAENTELRAGRAGYRGGP